MHRTFISAAHLLSAESISSTISQRTRASGDVAPYFFDAARAAWMASELSKCSERAVARRCWDKLEGAKADADAAKREVRRSFIFLFDLSITAVFYLTWALSAFCVL